MSYIGEIVVSGLVQLIQHLMVPRSKPERIKKESDAHENLLHESAAAHLENRG